MLKIIPIILICTAGTAQNECQDQPGRHLDRILPPSSEDASNHSCGGCFRYGLLYAARSNLVGPGTYPKVICEAEDRIASRLVRDGFGGGRASRPVAGGGM